MVMIQAEDNTTKTPPRGVQPISRALIKEGLRSFELDDETDLDSPLVPGDLNAVRADALDLDSYTLAFDVDDTILRVTSTWLDELAEQERSEADCESEFCLERSAQPPECISEEDRATLRRISEGQGPREHIFEDILEPLRLESTCMSTAPSILEETYEDQIQVLLEWNRSVSSIPVLDAERDELYAILEERCQNITQVEQGHRSPGDIDSQSSRLRKALRRFRPEVAHFENRSSLNTLVVIVANFRVAHPDIDLDLRDKMIETIFREIRLLMRTEEQHDVRDHLLETRLRAAYESGDRTVADCLRKEIRDAAKEDRKRCTERTIDRIKAARRAVRDQVLAELQNLTIPQAGMKWAAYKRLPVSYDLLRNSLDNEVATDHLQELLRDAEAACDADLANIVSTVGMAYGCHERTRRFGARDVPLKEREHAMLERLDDPKTYNMMMRVVDDRQAMSRVPEVILEHMTKLGESLGAALQVAKEEYRELDGWERALLDEDADVDLGLALVGKLMGEANTLEAKGRFGYCTNDDTQEDEVDI